ncbi:MAG TPA: DUF2784 domain-containing protein [Steroidobacteraceae bacterium]
MIHRLLADAVLVLHLGFVLFVVLGGLLVLRWPKLAWLHVPVVVWGAAIEFGGWICPLTPLEKWLREQGGEGAYSGGFIEHYLTVVIYPDGLTSRIKWMIGAAVLLINAAVYLVLWYRLRARH